jgi:hypothetical protein
MAKKCKFSKDMAGRRNKLVKEFLSTTQFGLGLGLFSAPDAFEWKEYHDIIFSYSVSGRQQWSSHGMIQTGSTNSDICAGMEAIFAPALIKAITAVIGESRSGKVSTTHHVDVATLGARYGFSF